MSMISVSVIGIIAVLLAVQLKNVGGAYSTYLIFASCSIVFFYGISKIETIVQALNTIQSYININPVYLESLLKMTGITYIAEFAAGICKDAGYGAVGTQIEIFGKLSILAISMPILLALLETIQGFLL